MRLTSAALARQSSITISTSIRHLGAITPPKSLLNSKPTCSVDPHLRAFLKRELHASTSTMVTSIPPSSHTTSNHPRDHILEQEYGRTFDIWRGPLKFASSVPLGHGDATGDYSRDRVDMSTAARGDAVGDEQRERWTADKMDSESRSSPRDDGRGDPPYNLDSSDGEFVRSRRGVPVDRPYTDPLLPVLPKTSIPASSDPSNLPSSPLPPLSQFIDLTISPPPPPPPPRSAISRGARPHPSSSSSASSSNHLILPAPLPLSRPRAVARYTSPEARTAMTPPRKVKSKGEGKVNGNMREMEVEHVDHLGRGRDVEVEEPEAENGLAPQLQTTNNRTYQKRLHPFFRPTDLTSSPDPTQSARSTQSQSTQSTQSSGSSALTPPPPPMASQPRMTGYYVQSSSSGSVSLSGMSSGSVSHSGVGSTRSEQSGFWMDLTCPSTSSPDSKARGQRPTPPSRTSSSSASWKSATSNSLPSRGPSPSPAQMQADGQGSIASAFARMSMHTSAIAGRASDGPASGGLTTSKGKGRAWTGLEAPLYDVEEVAEAMSTAPGHQRDESLKKALYPDLKELEAGMEKLGMGTKGKENIKIGTKSAGSTKREVTKKTSDSSASTSNGPQPGPSAVLTNLGKTLPVFTYSAYKALHPITDSDTPTYHPPQVVYITSVSEANDLIPCLTGNVMGFDLEWPVSMGKAKSQNRVTGKDEWREWMSPGKVALVQVGNEMMVLLIHLSLMESIPEKLIELCEDKSIYKIGVGIKNDGHKLVRDFDLRSRSLLELTHLARRIDPVGTGPGGALISLRNLTKAYLGYELPKGEVRRSDWSVPLSRDQVEYAANDVVSAVLIYHRLISIAKDRNLSFELPSMDLYEELASQEKVIGKAAGSRLAQAGLSPTELRSFVLFSMGKSSRAISEAMRTREDPLQLSTVQTYLVNAITKDTTLDYDKRSMHSMLSEGGPRRSAVHRATLVRLSIEMAQENAAIAKGIKVEEDDGL